MTSEIIPISTNTFLAPAAGLTTVLTAYQMKKEFIEAVLKPDVDYGTIPGSSKPSLLKPGAEKMATYFGLTPLFEDMTDIEDWTGEQHNGEQFFYYRQKCKLYRGDWLIASADGSCNSWEKKYRYRQMNRICPECGQETIFRSKQKPEYYCWSKKGGCGKTFKLNDTRITEQEVGQVKNLDVAEQVNTILKMAQKRALIAAVLIATNVSDYFTQDLEDFIDSTARDITPPVQPQEPTTLPQEDVVVPQDDGKLSQPIPPVNSTDTIYQAVIDANLAENTHAAKGALNWCKTGYDTPEKAIAWMRNYRGWKDIGKTTKEAADLANDGKVPK